MTRTAAATRSARPAPVWLVSRSGGIALAYDPNGRLFQTSGRAAGMKQFLYDGDALIGEYDANGTMLRRYIHGTDAVADDPLIWYEYGAAGYRRGLFTDHQGSSAAGRNRIESAAQPSRVRGLRKMRHDSFGKTFNRLKQNTIKTFVECVDSSAARGAA